MHKLSLFFLAILLVCVVTVFPLSSKAQQQEQGSFGESITPKTLNWTKFWSIFNAHSAWDLEYNNGSGWISRKSDLQIVKNYSRRVAFVNGSVFYEYNVDKSEASSVKIGLNFIASYTADYRLTFGIDLDVKNYTYKENAWNYTLFYHNYTVYFDWSDIAELPLDLINHGIMPVGDENYFWFRIRKNDVSEGTILELDPSFGETGTGDITATEGINYKDASRFQLTEDGSLTNISLYCYVASGTTYIRFIVYNDSSGDPYHLEGETQEIGISAGSVAWHTADFSTPLGLSAGWYHLGVHCGGIITWYVETGAGHGVIKYNADTYADGASDPFGSFSTYSSGHMCIYANYTTAGGATYNVNPSITVAFDLDTLVSPFLVFNQYSAVALDFALGTATQIFKTYIQTFGINLVFSLASTLDHITATWNVYPSIIVDFTLSSTVQIFRTFIEQHGVNLVFALSSLSELITGVFNVNPVVNVVFALSSTATYIQHHFYAYPGIVIDFVLSSTSTFVQHLYTVSTSLILDFALAATATFTAAAVYATQGFVLAAILLCCFIGGLAVAVIVVVRRTV